MVRALSMLLMLASCGRIGFGGTAISVQVTAAPEIALVAGDARVTFPGVDPDELFALPAHGSAIALPAQVLVGLPDRSGSAIVTVDADDTRGRPLTAMASTYVSAGDEQTVTVVLGANEPATCNDGILDGSETDVDCGGGACPACGLGSACVTASDCATGTCVNATCEPASGPPTWLPVASMPVGRMCGAAQLGTDARIYVFGGALSDGNVLYSEVDAYVPATDTWEPAPPLPTPRCRIAGAIDGTGTIYSLGGENVDLTVLTTVEVLAPGTSAWQEAPALPTAVAVLAATHDGNGTVIALGGDTTQTAALQLVGSIWTALPMLPGVKFDSGASLAPDGLVLDTGGYDSPDEEPETITTSTIAFDLVASTWTTVAPMVHARSDLQAVTGPDGRVYAVGGYNGTVGLDFAEAYRGDAAGWIELPSLSTGRDSGMAAVAADGRIFSFGGRTDMDSATGQTSAEAYGPRLQMSASAAAPGATLVVAGTNFAADANVRVYLDSTPLELATTDAGGTFAMAIVQLPITAASGLHQLRAIDDRSLYPVTYPLTIQ